MSMQPRLLVCVVGAAVALVGVSVAHAAPITQTVTHGTFTFSGVGGCGKEVVGEATFTEVAFRNVTPSGRVTVNSVLNSSARFTTPDGTEYMSHSTNTSNQTFSLDNSSAGHYSQLVFVREISLGEDVAGDELYLRFFTVRTIDANGNITQEHVDAEFDCR